MNYSYALCPHKDPSILLEAANCTTGEHRLVNGTNPLEGRVEICINNAWGTVCSTSFSGDEAEVICRNLGYLPPGNVLAHFTYYALAALYSTDAESPVAVRNPRFGIGTGPIFLEKLECNSKQSSLLDCDKATPTGLHHCTHEQDVGVICPGTKLT